MPAPDSAIVCIMIAASVMPRPAPPYSSGMQMPSQPASAMRLVEVGREAARRCPSSASRRRRTARRSSRSRRGCACWSSVSAKSMRHTCAVGRGIWMHAVAHQLLRSRRRSSRPRAASRRCARRAAARDATASTGVSDQRRRHLHVADRAFARMFDDRKHVRPRPDAGRRACFRDRASAATARRPRRAAPSIRRVVRVRKIRASSRIDDVDIDGALRRSVV